MSGYRRSQRQPGPFPPTIPSTYSVFSNVEQWEAAGAPGSVPFAYHELETPYLYFRTRSGFYQLPYAYVRSFNPLQIELRSGGQSHPTTEPVYFVLYSAENWENPTGEDFWLEVSTPEDFDFDDEEDLGAGEVYDPENPGYDRRVKVEFSSPVQTEEPTEEYDELSLLPVPGFRRIQ